MGIGVVISFALRNVNAMTGAQGMMAKLFVTAANGTKVLSSLGMAFAAVAAAAALMKAGMAGINATMGNVKAYADYETELAHVQGLLNVSREEMSVLEDQATSLAQTTRFTRGEIMESYWELLSAGFDVAQVMEMVQGTLMVAVSGHMETADAVNVLTSALLGFGYTADDTIEVLDVLQTYIRYTKIHWSDFAASLGRFSSTAAATNQTLEETAAMFGLIMSRGLPAARSATLLRVMLSELQEVGNSPDLMRQLADAGVNIINPLTGEFRSLVDIMDDINRAFPEISALPSIVAEDEMAITEAAFERLGILGDIFGRRGIAGFYSAITASQQLNGVWYEGTDYLRELIRLGEEEAGGALIGYYSSITETFNEKMLIIKSTWQTIKEQMGQGIAEYLVPILDSINQALIHVSAFLVSHPEIAKAISWAVLIGSIVSIFIGAVIMIAVIVKALMAFKLAAFVVSLLSGVGIALLIVGAIVALGYLFWDDIEPLVMTLWKYIQAGAAWLWKVMKELWPGIKAGLGIVALGIASILIALYAAIGFILVGLQVIWGVIQTVWYWFIGLLTGQNVDEEINAIWVGVVDNINKIKNDFLDAAGSAFMEIGTKILGWIEQGVGLNAWEAGAMMAQETITEAQLAQVMDTMENANWWQNMMYNAGEMRGALEWGTGLGTMPQVLGEGPVHAPASEMRREPTTLNLGGLTINFTSTGDSTFDGEKAGMATLDYIRSQLDRVMP